MYYRRGLFRLRDWFHKILVGMGEWFPGCTTKHELSERAFSSEENDIFHYFWTFSKNCSLFPGRCPLPGGLQGGLQGDFRVHMVFFAVGVYLEKG